ncbi:MAG: hypothetical protein Q4F65_07745 [Propionibacteriaceae bacterium]|nr:hypothetical protein [Propionibacteriaceae bacterium]
MSDPLPSGPQCPHCQRPLPGWTPSREPDPLPPREPGYAEHHPQQDGGHVANRSRPAFAPGWASGPTASDPDGHGLLRGMMGSFTREEVEEEETP